MEVRVMRVFESLSRVVIACVAATVAWSCDSGTGPKERPSGGEAGGPAGESPAPTPKPAASPAPTPPSAPAEKKEEPQYVTVQHILIGFRGSVPGKGITRSKEEAQTLAESLLARAKGGEDFDALVREYTDDSHPGIYKMSNHGVPAPPGGDARGGMVAAFGDVGFPLEVGGVGMAAHHSTKSPYGWHIIKRME